MTPNAMVANGGSMVWNREAGSVMFKVRANFEWLK